MVAACCEGGLKSKICKMSCSKHPWLKKNAKMTERNIPRFSSGRILRVRVGFLIPLSGQLFIYGCVACMGRNGALSPPHLSERPLKHWTPLQRAPFPSSSE